MTRFAAPTLFGTDDPAEPLTFPKLEALARHIHAVRDGAGLAFAQGRAALDEEADFPVLHVYALKPEGRVSLGMAAGPALETPDALLTALHLTRQKAA